MIALNRLQSCGGIDRVVHMELSRTGEAHDRANARKGGIVWYTIIWRQPSSNGSMCVTTSDD